MSEGGRKKVWDTVVNAVELLSGIDDPDLRILDCRHQLTDPGWGRHQFAAGHLPGAVHAHIDDDLSSRPTSRTGRHPLPDPEAFRRTVGNWGIDETTQVIAYDDQGGIWAARAWWLLQDYGHARAAVLDGGIQAWLDAGGRLSQAVAAPAPRTFRGDPGHRPRVEAQELQQGVAVGTLRVLDARAPERYRGDVEPIDPVAGHIPGAASMPAVSLVTAQRRFLPRSELRTRLQGSLAGRSAENVAAYCGSGVTACHVVLAFEAAGLGSIRLYPGSWSEWIRDPTRPVAKGEEPLDRGGRTDDV